MKSPEEPHLSLQSQDFHDQHNKLTNFIGCGPRAASRGLCGVPRDGVGVRTCA